MKTINPIKMSVFSIGLATLCFLATIASAPAQVPCVETNGVKYLQSPNLAGFDVSDSLGYVLADDFVCTNSGPVTDIHIWGSWLSDVHGAITNFWLGIYSDVPAVTNPASGMVTPSHPGNLLWSNSFPQGQFSESELESSQEQFISPGSSSIIGPDSQVWYYCFYPQVPFDQRGSTAAPVTYWLAAYAQGIFGAEIVNPPQYGWKTTFSVQNDASVNMPWTGALPASGASWNVTTTPPNSPGGAQPVDLAFMLTTATNVPPPCCPETNGVKYLQPPNTSTGIDVDATDVRGGTLADDFPCTTTGPVSDIHLWGSWYSDQVDYNATFILSIWSDVPASPASGNPSHPGVMLWTQTFGPNDYFMCPYLTIPEPFDDPKYTSPIAPPTVVPFGDSTNLYYLCFYPTNPFVQQGTAAAPTNYWLSVTETDPNSPGGLYWGWKTSSQHYNDAAVYTMHPATPTWTALVDANDQQYDLSFKINTATNQSVPVVCVESDREKYVQGPNTIGGYDVQNTPYVLADDFVCTNTGPVSDIHLWGSWLSNNALTNTINFWLGIYNDVPAVTNVDGHVTTPSHPGTNLMWQQWFYPGQYAETIWTANADEQFLDPGSSNVIGSDSIVWYYCFYPTNAFEQLGTPTNHITYWLAAYAQLPVGTAYNYGWKTTTNVMNDTSVHAVWPGMPPTNNPSWMPTAAEVPSSGPPTFTPLDLAFKITSCGPVSIQRLAPTNVIVTWQGGGYLQSASNVVGPYTDVPGAPTSPFTDYSVNPTNKFYRLRCYP